MAYVKHERMTAIATGGSCWSSGTNRQCHYAGQFLNLGYEEALTQLEHLELQIGNLDAPNELPSGSSGWGVSVVSRQ